MNPTLIIIMNLITNPATTLFTVIVACVLGGYAFDRLAATAWMKAHGFICVVLFLTIFIGGAVLVHKLLNLPSDYFAVLFGFWLGGRFGEIGRKRTADKQSRLRLSSEIKQAWEARVTPATTVKLDVTNCTAPVLNEKIIELVKAAYNVSVIHNYNDNRLTLIVSEGEHGWLWPN